mgnify:CR=1 FL=1
MFVGFSVCSCVNVHFYIQKGPNVHSAVIHVFLVLVTFYPSAVKNYGQGGYA